MGIEELIYIDQRSERLEDGCIVWAGGHTPLGYGMTWFRGKQTLAHRAVWTATHGDIPPGLVVRHTCDRRDCVNPAHLLLGTQKDNMADASARGRTTRGVRSSTVKLTERQVRIIRARYADGATQVKLAARYRVKQGTISQIVARKTWAHIR